MVTILRAHLAALESGKRPKGGVRELEDGVPSIGAENISGIGRHDFAGEKFIPRESFREMRKGVVREPMSANPEQALIYHGTDVANLPGILTDGGLRSDAVMAEQNPTVIGYGHINERRLKQIGVACCGGRLSRRGINLGKRIPES